MDVSSFHSTLPAGADGAAPEWVHLVPAGRFSGVDGRGPYTLADPAAVINASLAGDARLPIDENHATDVAAPRGEPSPARGWIVGMEARSDGIWGRVEWTDSGRALMADRAYRGLSPVFVHDKDKRVVRILRAALTNTPNLSQLASLNSQEPTMDLARMRTALGLAADADEAAILAAIERGATERTALQSQLTTLQATMVKPELVVELQAQIAEMQSGRARERAIAFVDGAIRDGKPIAPLRDHFVARHMLDAQAVELEIGKFPSLHAGGIGDRTARHAPQDGDGLTDDERMMARKMRLDPKKFGEELKRTRRAA